MSIDALIFQKMIIKYAYSVNVTTTYFIILNFWFPVGVGTFPVIVIVHYDPDITQCGSRVYKTPTKTSYYRPKYNFKNIS
jgi:hypothetical protein